MRAQSVEDEVRGLEDLDLVGLRQVWQACFGPPPRLRSVPILRLMLAWRLQAKAYGGLDAGNRKAIRAKAKPPSEPSISPGSTIRRVWRGRTIEVTVETGGFRFEGELSTSLSAIAERVTGTRWNGPRFFGLRQ